MAWQRFKVKIPKHLKPKERQVIAQEIIDRIVERTRVENRNKNGYKFRKYSKNYTKSRDFRLGGKSKSKVDLTLTGEMMDSLELQSDRNGELTIGFDKTDSKLNGKAEGNIKGTYGNKKQVAAKRDFLGITRKDLTKIVNKYKKPLLAETLLKAKAAKAAAEKALNNTKLEDLG